MLDDSLRPKNQAAASTAQGNYSQSAPQERGEVAEWVTPTHGVTRSGTGHIAFDQLNASGKLDALRHQGGAYWENPQYHQLHEQNRARASINWNVWDNIHNPDGAKIGESRDDGKIWDGTYWANPPGYVDAWSPTQGNHLVARNSIEPGRLQYDGSTINGFSEVLTLPDGTRISAYELLSQPGSAVESYKNRVGGDDDALMTGYYTEMPDGRIILGDNWARGTTQQHLPLPAEQEIWAAVHGSRAFETASTREASSTEGRTASATVAQSRHAESIERKLTELFGAENRVLEQARERIVKEILPDELLNNGNGDSAR